MGEQKFEIGLGEMGRNLALNIADHGIPIAVYNRTAEKTKEFMTTEGAGQSIGVGFSLSESTKLLRRPRAIW